MPRAASSTRSMLFGVIVFLEFSLLFAIAYAQSPLYTSNQDQYFLHAYANLGYGYLSQDWLANTLDPTPVFTGLATLSLGYLRTPIVFYAFYALLMGVYLFSLLGIGRLLWSDEQSKQKWLVLLALLFLTHSAGWRFGLSRLLGDNWRYVLEDGVADQRMLGPVFEPSCFGVFLAFSVYLFLRGRPYLAVLSAVLAATFHATYVLPAGILTLAYVYVVWRRERDLAKAFSVGLLALLAVMPMVIYAVTLFSGGSAESASQARHILVEYRIPHHALVAQWLDATAVVKITLVILALYLVRRRPLFWLLCIPAALATVLTLVQVITGNLALALLFPWRISILLVPLAVTVILAILVERLAPLMRSRTVLFRAASLALIALTVIVGGIRFVLDLQRKAQVPERDLYTYVDRTKTSGEVYLIPVKMQDFRLETLAPAYVDFKSIPYKDVDVLEWYRRNQAANRFYKSPDCDLLPEMVAEGVTHVVTPSRQELPACPDWAPVYSDRYYDVYRHDNP